MVYSITRINMGKQDIRGYTGYTVLLRYSWVHRIYRGIQYCTNILGSLYGDCHELLAENLFILITWPYTDRPSAPQGYQCFISYLLASLGARVRKYAKFGVFYAKIVQMTPLRLRRESRWFCTSMLWSIDRFQNRVSADQYHLTVSRRQVSTDPSSSSIFWSHPLTT